MRIWGIEGIAVSFLIANIVVAIFVITQNLIPKKLENITSILIQKGEPKKESKNLEET